MHTLWKTVLTGMLCVSLVSFSKNAESGGVIAPIASIADIETARAELSVDRELEEYLELQLSFGGTFYNSEDEPLESEIQMTGLEQGYGTMLIYLNGINTNRSTFDRDKFTLKVVADSADAIPSATAGYGMYNISGMQNASNLSLAVCHQIISDLWVSDDAILYEYCSSRMMSNGLIDEFTQLPWQYFSLLTRFVTNDDYVDQDTVEYAADVIEATVSAGKRVILVCHSQGCFYTRDILRDIKKNNPYSSRFFESIGVVMLGSPARSSSLPDGVRVHRISECNDPVTKLTLITPCVRGNAGVTWIEAWAAQYNLINELMNWINVEAHSFSQTYMNNHVVLSEVKAAFRNLDTSVVNPRYTYLSGDRVATIDRLNVRASDGTLKYTVDAGSLAQVFSEQVVLQNDYIRASVKFDDNTTATLPNGQTTTIGAMPSSDQYGFVATGWLRYDMDHPSLVGPPNPLEQIPAQHYEMLDVPDGGALMRATPALYAAYELPYPENTPDESGSQPGLGGCANCIDAPPPFEIYRQTLDCYNGEPRLKLRWTRSRGRDYYEVYRAGGVLMGTRTYTTFTDRNGLVPGEVYKYYITAVEGDATRTSSNAWRVEIPHTICGGPEPPEPYDGPRPTVETVLPEEVEMNTAMVASLVNPNGIYNSAYFEHGLSPLLGESTNPYPLGNGTEDVAFSWSIPIQCDDTVYYRVATSHQFGVEYGNTLSFEAPSCASEDPSELLVEHNVFNNALDLSWIESLLPSSTVLEIKLKVMEDPRPDVEKDVWTTRPYQSSGIGAWSDEWLDPKPGGKYCYKVRTWNTAAGSGGYSGYSNTRCITIEGVLEQFVDFPASVEVRISLGAGLSLVGVGGTGDFEIYRNVNGGAFTFLTSIESGDINFLDTDVLSGNTYCYQFVQDGIISQEYCKTYLSADAIGTPTLLSISRIDEYWVEIQFTSAIPEEGYFRIWNNYHMEGWINGGGTAFYTGSNTISKSVVSEGAYPACIKVEQLLNGISTGFSNELCLAVGESDTDYSAPGPADSPKDLRVNGSVSPLGIRHAPIYFDSEYVNERSEISATHVQVQVSYDSSNWSELLWDSGMKEMSSGALPGQRVERLAYGGDIPLPNVPVYWRTRITDETGVQGKWSVGDATFSIASYDSSLLGIWSVNGAPGTLGKLEDNRSGGTHSIVEIGNPSVSRGFDEADNGSYFLKRGPYLELGEVYTPGTDPVSISMELRGLSLPSGQAELVHAYDDRRGSYISVYVYKVNCCVAKLGVIIKDARGNITSYGDSPDMISQSFRKIDINIYNNPDAMIEIFVDGMRYSQWPVFSENSYTFSSELTWLVGAAMDTNTGNAYKHLYGRVDEIQIYNRVRTEAEVYDSYVYSRQ